MLGDTDYSATELVSQVLVSKLLAQEDEDMLSELDLAVDKLIEEKEVDNDGDIGDGPGHNMLAITSTTGEEATDSIKLLEDQDSD